MLSSADTLSIIVTILAPNFDVTMQVLVRILVGHLLEEAGETSEIPHQELARSVAA